MSRNTVRCQNPACRARLVIVHGNGRIEEVVAVDRARGELVCICGLRRPWSRWIS